MDSTNPDDDLPELATLFTPSPRRSQSTDTTDYAGLYGLPKLFEMPSKRSPQRLQGASLRDSSHSKRKRASRTMNDFGHGSDSDSSPSKRVQTRAIDEKSGLNKPRRLTAQLTSLDSPTEVMQPHAMKEVEEAWVYDSDEAEGTSTNSALLIDDD